MTQRQIQAVAILFFAIGLSGHLAAANVEGGHAIHYRHHITGFVILSLGCGVIVAFLGRRLWKLRSDIILLIVGILQTILGWWVYVMFSHKA